MIHKITFKPVILDHNTDYVTFFDIVQKVAVGNLLYSFLRLIEEVE